MRGESTVLREQRHGNRGAPGATRRQRAAECSATLAQITHLRAVIGWTPEGKRLGLLIAQWKVEAIAERDEVAALELLLLVRGHAALARTPHAITFLGLGEDDRGAILGSHGLVICSVDLHQVMTASLEAVDLIVGQALRKRSEFRILAKEMVAVVAAVLGSECLKLAVDRAGKGACEGTRVVACEKAVPVRSPYQLDDPPAGALEQRLELIDDAAVAAHRTVEALKIAVDDPDQVVEPLTCGQSEGAHAFGLVHFAVAKDAPHLALIRDLQAAMLEVAHEARMVDRRDWPDAHRAGGELPEVGHQPGVRVTGQPLRSVRARADLLPVVSKGILAEPSLEERSRIDTWRGMGLEEDEVR